jgi:hypothetical protein
MVVVAFCAALLAACSSQSIDPVGIGSGRDDLKRSPCACLPVPQDYSAWS